METRDLFSDDVIEDIAHPLLKDEFLKSSPVSIQDHDERKYADKKYNEVILLGQQYGFVNIDIANIILFAEKDGPFLSFENSKIEYRVALDNLNKLLNLSSFSHLALKSRPKQMSCSSDYTKDSLSLNITKYDPDIQPFFVTDGIFYVDGICERSIKLLNVLNSLSNLLKHDMMTKIRFYAAEIEHKRLDDTDAIFGIGFDYDPTYEPDNLSDVTRSEIKVHLNHYSIHTSKGDNKYRVIWTGRDISAGERIAFIQGQIKSQCDNVLGSKYVRHLHYHKLLVDMENVHTSNWTREIGKTKDIHLSNVTFSPDGGVVTTRLVKKGEELLEYVNK